MLPQFLPVGGSLPDGLDLHHQPHWSGAIPGRPWFTPHRLRWMTVSKSPPQTSRLKIGLS